MPVKLRSAVYRPVPVTFSLPSCRRNPGAVWTVANARPPSARRRILSGGRPALHPEVRDRLVPRVRCPGVAPAQGDGLGRNTGIERRKRERVGGEASRPRGARDGDVRAEGPVLAQPVGDAGTDAGREIGQSAPPARGTPPPAARASP